MAAETFANLPTTTVTSGGTTAPAGGTTQTWTVASSASFPSVSTGVTQLHVADVALNSEIILVTNISGTTWSVTRGAEGTTPVAHGAGFTVYQVATAGFLNAVSGAERPATLLVAASGASTAWKNTADYVCTGTNDDVKINAAMAALPTQGGTVLLSDGTFTIGAPLIPTINNTRLLGQGLDATIVAAATNANCNGYQYDRTLQAYNLIFCAIEGITFDGAAGGTTGHGCFINYTNATNTFWDFYLRDVWFKGWPGDGFRSTGGHGYVLDHVISEFNGGIGINFTGGFIDSPPRIVNGTVKLNTGTGIVINVIDALVSGMEISSNSGSYGLEVTASGCKAIGNQVKNNTGTGIHVGGGSEGHELLGNTISNNDLHGLLLDDANCTVTGNFFTGNSITSAGASDEINIAHGTFSAVGNLITGNVIDCASQSRYGINFSVSTDTAGVAVANRIIAPVTAAVNTAAADTQWVATTGVSNTPTTDLSLYLAPSGATGETYPRGLCNNNTAALTTQQSVVSAIPLPGGLPIVNLGVMVSSTGFSGVTHGWLALLDSSRIVRAVTADQTSSFGSAFTALSIPVAAGYTTPSGGLYYLAACVTASTMGTFSIGVSPGGAPTGTPPILAGTSGGSLTTPPATGSTMATITSNGTWRFYGYTS